MQATLLSCLEEYVSFINLGRYIKWYQIKTLYFANICERIFELLGSFYIRYAALLTSVCVHTRSVKINYMSANYTSLCNEEYIH